MAATDKAGKPKRKVILFCIKYIAKIVRFRYNNI